MALFLQSLQLNARSLLFRAGGLVGGLLVAAAFFSGLANSLAAAV